MTTSGASFAPPKRRSRGALSALAAALVLGGAMGAVAARNPIVRLAPGTARLYAAIGLPVNLRGLALDNLRTSMFDAGDKRMLTVEGAVVNLRDEAVEAPNMRIALRDADRREIYVWTAPAPKSKLGPREQAAFRTRLASPPEGARDVVVRFASASDKPSPIEDGL